MHLDIAENIQLINYMLSPLSYYVLRTYVQSLGNGTTQLA